ncbi:MAG TPA: hypothetical protein VEN99_11375, partial [Acidimicrobiia bacterium]|nr:hypothetical protein [Acidimicrobiia bacterium]
SVGEPFADALDAGDGRSAVDRALRDPPRAEADIMDAVRYLRGDRPRKVAAPVAPPGARVAKRNDLGELRWLLLLAERIPAGDALQAADGWAGDAYLVYEAGGRMCVKADFDGARPAEGDRGAGAVSSQDRMAAALGRWAATMPAAAGAAVSRRGALVELASCDPGPAALSASGTAGPPPAESHVDEAMKLLTDRASAFVAAVDDGEAHVSPRR